MREIEVRRAIERASHSDVYARQMGAKNTFTCSLQSRTVVARCGIWRHLLVADHVHRGHDDRVELRVILDVRGLHELLERRPGPRLRRDLKTARRTVSVTRTPSTH